MCELRCRRLTPSPAYRTISPPPPPPAAVAVPGVTLDQLSVETSPVLSVGTRSSGDADRSYSIGAGGACSGVTTDACAGGAGIALQGLSRLLYLSGVCERLFPATHLPLSPPRKQARTTSPSARSARIGGDRFARLRSFLESDCTARHKIVIFGLYELFEGASAGAGGGGVPAGARAHVNAPRSLIVHASDVGANPARLDLLAGSEDARRGILVGTMAQPMDCCRRTAAWVAIEQSPTPAEVGGYTECLEFKAGPRMREAFDDVGHKLREYLWYRPGMLVRGQQRPLIEVG